METCDSYTVYMGVLMYYSPVDIYYKIVGKVMFILTWNHTRTGKAMTEVCDTYGQAWIRISMVRQIFPNHPFTLNGKSV